MDRSRSRAASLLLVLALVASPLAAAIVTVTALVAAPPAGATGGPGAVAAGGGGVAVAAGLSHTCALQGGAVRCWGENDRGQLGQGDTARRGDGPGEIAALAPVPLARAVVQIAPGGFHTCVLLDDATVTCWGADGFGQLGLGDRVDRGRVPGEVAALTPLPLAHPVAEITAGYAHTCARFDDGTVTCWGNNSFGQLGLGDGNDRGDDPGELGTLVPLPRAAIGITAGLGFTCALLDDGTATCWGLNSSGELGVGDMDRRGDQPGEIGTLVPLPRPAARIVAGMTHVCALLDDGTVTCWGSGYSGELGVGDTLRRGDQPGEIGTLVPLPRAAVAVTAGMSITCALLGDGTVTCWGNNTAGELGVGDTNARGDEPGEIGTLVPLPRTAVAVTVGEAHGCATLDDGTVTCWGNNTAGELGVGDTTVRGDQPGETGALVPLPPTAATVAQVAAGGVFTCARLDDGRVKCWGGNARGQLGQGDTAARGDQPGELGDALAPVDLGTGARAAQLATGFGHACVRLADGRVKCWGGNGSGRLGQGDIVARGSQPGELGDALAPVDLGTGARAVQLVAGSGYSCALLADGAVKCWGSNGSGVLGQGDLAARGDEPGEMGANLPAVDLGPGARVRELSAGDAHVCALLTTGTVKCWGWNLVGQLGLGDTADRGDDANEMGANLPAVDLGTGVRVAHVAAAGAHTCALLADGTVTCWGGNGHGQLGLGDTANRGDGANEMGANLPAVDLAARAVEISAGGTGTCARSAAGTVSCWGGGAAGQLGLGDTTDRGDGANEMGANLPAVDLGTGRRAAGIDLGLSHSCARLADATSRCWGYGADGALGLGDTADRGDGANEMGANLPAIVLVQPPQASIAAPLDSAGGRTVVFTINASETVAGLTADDLSTAGTATGCIATPASSPSWTSLDVSVTCATNGTLVLRVRAGAVVDGSQNPGPSAVVSSSEVQVADPTPTAVWFAPDSPVDGTSFGYTLTFSEQVSGFAASDLTITGTAPGCVAFPAGGSEQSFFVPVQCAGDGTVILTLAAGSVTDAGGNPAPAAPVAASTVVLGVPATITALVPQRMLDTRSGIGNVAKQRLGGLVPLVFHVAGTNGVPSSGAAAVSLNVTVVEPTTDGYATVYPCGTLPNTSNVNFRAGVTTANAVITPVSSSGDICIAVFGEGNVIADVNGWFAASAGFSSLTPTRLLDTRTGTGGVPRSPIGGTTMPLAPLRLQVAGTNGVPSSGAAAVSLNVTVVEPTTDGYATVYPCGTMPETSNVNFVAGQTTANAVTAPLSATGDLCIAVFGRAQVIADVSGWFANDTGFDALTPARLLDTRSGVGGVATGRIGSTTMPLTPLRFTVAGRAGVPSSGASAVSLNVTIVEPTTDGYATVYPCGTLPNTSNVNFRAGFTTANAVIAPLSGAGEFCIAVFGDAHVIADVNGWYRT